VKSMSIALESRWPEPEQSQVNDEHVADLDGNSGRCGTRTHDLSRVNPFRYREWGDTGRRTTT
jgi:hypothetical protein